MVYFFKGRLSLIRCLVDNLMRKSFSFNNILSLLYRRFKPEALDKMEFMNKTEPEMISCMLNIYILKYTPLS